MYNIEREFKEFLTNDNALYHYTKLDTAFNYILKEMKLKFSKLSDFSDPMESIYRTLNGNFWEDSDDTLNNFFIVNSSVKEMIARAYVLCFCSNQQIISNKPGNIYSYLTALESINDDHKDYFSPIFGYEKNRMWDMYADKYKGVCLIFDKSMLKETMKLYYSECDVMFSKNVLYYKNIKRATNSINCNCTDTQQESLERFEERLFSKLFDYRDENEYRYAILLQKYKFNDDIKVKIDIANSLKGIIFGCFSDESKIQELKKANKTIKIFRQTISSAGFNYDFISE